MEDTADVAPEPFVPATPAVPVDHVTPAPAVPAATPARPAIAPVSTTRGLLGASFELLTRSNADMRRASFYVGAVTLVTIGPLLIYALMLDPVAFVFFDEEIPIAPESDQSAFGILMILAMIGVIVSIVESRTLSMAVLGGRAAGRTITTRQALARSRMCFWRAVVAAVVIAIPIGLAQSLVTEVIFGLMGEAFEVSLITSTLVTAIVGAPLAYVLAGVVLGDVDPFEAIKRSVRVFRARKVAAALVAGFETIGALLLLFGLGAGLDIVLRLFDGLGLGPDSGPVGVAATALAIVASSFALGTLLYTVFAITIAPQVVMFVGLTHATIGLDRVLPGGSNDPESKRPAAHRLRWFTRPMTAGAVIGAVVLVAVIVSGAR